MGFLTNIKSVLKKEEKSLDVEVPNSIELPNKEESPEIEIVSSSSMWNNYQYSIDFNSESTSVNSLIKEYRELALYPEIDEAIVEIVNEAIVQDGTDVLTLNIESEDIPDSLKKTIVQEFNKIVSMMDFNNRGDTYFRQWYEDGRLYIHGVIDTKQIKNGIQDIKILSPFNLKQIKEKGQLFFIYDDSKSQNALKIPSEHITFVHSSLTDPNKNFYIGHLHKAIKPYNQLKLLEDSAVIYRITRAPERRVFYIDVGQMNKSKAESYISSLISKFKNKITYDSSTGKMDQRKNVMSMTEDFWLPSSESSGGSRGTRIDVLPSGSNLGELEDIKYFNKKLKKSLNVPFSRFDSDERSTLAFGSMNGELGRDEIRFNKFINKLRYNFAQLFYDLLKKQLIFKKILTKEDWYKYKESFKFKWNSDSYFSEVKRGEILKNRVELADAMSEYVGKYFSHEYLMKNIFNMTDEQIEEEFKKIEEEKNNKTLNSPEEDY